MKNDNPSNPRLAATPLGDLRDLLAFTDEQLRVAILQAREECRPAQWKYAELIAQGESASKALRVAYGSKVKTSPGQPMKVAAVAQAVALLREEYARKAGTTARELRVSWVKIRDAAFAAGKFEAANRANELLARLAGLFPEQQLKLTVQHELVDHREVTPAEIEALSLLRHGVRRQLPGQVIEAHFEPALVPGDLETAGQEAKAGDGSSQDRQMEADDAP